MMNQGFKITIVVILSVIMIQLILINGFLHDIVDTRLVNIQNFLETIKNK